MSLSNIVRTPLGERVRLTYTPDAPALPEQLDVFVNLTNSGVDQVVVREVGGARPLELFRAAYPFEFVLSDAQITNAQRTAFFNGLRSLIEQSRGVTIPVLTVSDVDSQDIYIDHFAADWLGESGSSFAFSTILDTEEKLAKLDGPDAGTEADVNFRYEFPAWDQLTAAQRAKVGSLVDNFVGAFIGEFPA